MDQKEQRRSIGWAAASTAVGVAAVLFVGCSTPPPTMVVRPHATLIQPPSHLADHWDVAPYEDNWDWGWEQYRNDEAMGVGSPTGLPAEQYVEIRSLDRQWSQNGRVRENSRTTTRTLRRGWIQTR